MTSNIGEINKLKEVYNQISESYQNKKHLPWYELKEHILDLYDDPTGVFVDAGCGNGRNLIGMNKTLSIGLDFSENLLRNFVADPEVQRIVGSVTKLPLRSSSCKSIISIAVIHHLPDDDTRQQSLMEFARTSRDLGFCFISVWRKWRTGQRQKIFEKIRRGEDIAEFVDHLRPWKDSDGKPLGYRYYHYYTWKELYFQINKSNLKIIKRTIMGGKQSDDNFLVKLKK